MPSSPRPCRPCGGTGIIRRRSNPTARETCQACDGSGHARHRGRPPKPEGTAASIRVEVYLTPTQAAQLDTDRGDVPRSAWLARRAGLR